MANKNLFQTVRGMFTPKADALNEAGGTAYNLTPKAALAQYAATGCFSNTFYTDAGEQLDKVLALAKELDAEFVAKTAVYSREKGFMKDMPALLVAVLSTKDNDFPFGKIDTYQTILFMAAHSRRHTAQIEEILNNPGFPKKGKK
jgi:60 kDa SS-A/Ro ribonucleoprotein